LLAKAKDDASELAAGLVKGGADVGTELRGTDEHHGDQRGDKGIFDRGDGMAVLKGPR
jgi:hypothetical protein